MEHLLDDIPLLVADYLPPLDAISFSRTCRKLQSQLSLTATPRRRILTDFIRNDCNDDHHYGFRIPVISQVAVHSMLVSMSWKDQGWGFQKGRVFVVAEEETQAHDGSGRGQESFGGYRFVYSSGIAPHNFEQLSLILKPRRNESYHLWYIVGGGGGHSLHISNMSVHALVFDDRRRTFGQVLNFFDNSNTLRSWDETESSSQVHRFHSDALNAVLTSTSHALTHGLKVLPPMISFFADYGVPELDLSPKLIELIVSMRNDLEQELSIYTNAEHIGDEREDDEGGGEELVLRQQRHFQNLINDHLV